MWKGNGNTATLLFFPESIWNCTSRKKPIVMEHFNGILFNKSGPVNKQHTNQSINTWTFAFFMTLKKLIICSYNHEWTPNIDLNHQQIYTWLPNNSYLFTERLHKCDIMTRLDCVAEVRKFFTPSTRMTGRGSSLIPGGVDILTQCMRSMPFQKIMELCIDF